MRQKNIETVKIILPKFLVGNSFCGIPKNVPKIKNYFTLKVFL
jgi:hypothetical protein